MRPQIQGFLKHDFLAPLQVLQFYVPHLTALGVALVLGATMGLTTTMKKPPAVDTTDRWALPHWTVYHAGPKRDELARMDVWAEEPGKKKDAVATQPAAPPWRFIGTVKDGQKLMAVIELDQGKKVQRLATGDALPNGAQIMFINSGALTYAEDNEQKTLTLFATIKDQNFPAPPKKK